MTKSTRAQYTLEFKQEVCTSHPSIRVAYEKSTKVQLTNTANRSKIRSSYSYHR